MENNQDILIELKEISPLLIDLQKKVTFSVAAEYFANFSNNILKAIQQETEAKYFFSTEMPYKVPPNYFDTLSHDILSKIHQTNNDSVEEELKTIAPLLNTISKKPVFKVPDAYFDNSIANAPSGKVVKMNVWKKYLTYAVAASVLVIVGVGLFYFNNQNQHSNAAVAVSQQVKDLSEEEIIQYINTDVADGFINATAFKKSSVENDLSKSVKQMSDKEIRQYLDELGDKEGI